MNLNDKAMLVYDSIATRFPSHKIIDNVMMARADILIKTGQYQLADQVLEEITMKYPQGLLAADALFLRARLHETMLGNTEQAMELYQTLVMEFPGSLNTVTARNRYRFLRGDNTADEEFFFNHKFTP
jgi:TolA-binding protein